METSERDQLLEILCKYLKCSNAKARKIVKDLDKDNAPKDKTHYQGIAFGKMPGGTR